VQVDLDRRFFLSSSVIKVMEEGGEGALFCVALHGGVW
jgi:hypothetical protein